MPRKLPLLILLALLLLIPLLRPRWYLNLTKQVEVSPQVGAALVEKYDCRSCHVIGGSGALKAPNLDEAVKRESEETLYGWLANPRSMKANTAMPNFHLSDSEIGAILAYLQSLR
ncbi:MAG TPA: cytochrome c [Anaerolineales bacterium]|nr:cytochrome c [Anaerolineales bacterium]